MTEEDLRVSWYVAVPSELDKLGTAYATREEAIRVAKHVMGGAINTVYVVQTVDVLIKREPEHADLLVVQQTEEAFKDKAPPHDPKNIPF